MEESDLLPKKTSQLRHPKAKVGANPSQVEFSNQIENARQLQEPAASRLFQHHPHVQDCLDDAQECRLNPDPRVSKPCLVYCIIMGYALS